MDTGPQDDAAIRAVIANYLASATLPDSLEIDPENIAPDILAVWSDGKTYEGREEVLRGLQAVIDKVSPLLESFEVEPDHFEVHRSGQMAWVVTQISITGVVKDNGETIRDTTHSTFVFEKRDGRWQIVHERSTD